jgi:hypothetical protein
MWKSGGYLFLIISMTRAIIATTSVQKRKRASQVMYIGIPPLPRKEKRYLTSPKCEEATAPFWYSYGLAPLTL